MLSASPKPNAAVAPVPDLLKLIALAEKLTRLYIPSEDTLPVTWVEALINDARRALGRPAVASMTESSPAPSSQRLPLCVNCRHFARVDQKYKPAEQCRRRDFGMDLVTGDALTSSCTQQRGSNRIADCGIDGRHFEIGEAAGSTTLALSALPQDLFRTLQRAASCLDLDVNGLTAAEVVDRYTALGAQITLDFAARILREGTNTGTCDADVAIAELDQCKLPVGREVNDSASGHARSVSNAEGGA